MTIRAPLRSWRRVALVFGFLVAAAGSASLAAAETVAPPIPAGQARLWLYRDWLPSESLNLANVSLNGVYFGSIANGSVIYRDIAPGRYRIAPMSFVPNATQDTVVELAPGQQAFIKIVSLGSWGSDNTAAKNIDRDAFWAWLTPPAVAQTEIARVHSGF
jgi:hypothetical protein